MKIIIYYGNRTFFINHVIKYCGANEHILVKSDERLVKKHKTRYDSMAIMSSVHINRVFSGIYGFFFFIT